MLPTIQPASCGLPCAVDEIAVIEAEEESRSEPCDRERTDGSQRRSSSKSGLQAWSDATNDIITPVKGFFDWEAIGKYGGIGAGACLGWFTRFFLKKLFTVELGVTGSGNGGAAHGDLLANMLGAFVGGMLGQLKNCLLPWHPSIFWGLSIGFCGSCTTFSSWMAEAALQMWVPSGVDGEQLYAEQLVRGILLIVIGLLCLLQSFRAGKAAGTSLKKRLERPDGDSKKVLQQAIRMKEKSFVYWCILLAMWLMVLIMSGRSATIDEALSTVSATDRLSLDLLAGMCFAPLGAWARFELAKHNSLPWCSNFPVFTYAANMLGMAMSITCWVLAATFEPEEEKHHLLRSHTWIVAVSGGLCGCLSTASTFASELHALAAQGSTDENALSGVMYALRYGTISILSAQSLACAVVVPFLALHGGTSHGQ